jgi:hypothetical protein
MRLITIILLCTACFLSACSGSSGNNNTNNTSSTSSSPPSTGTGGGSPSTVPDAHVIDNEDMTAGLKGVDADKNGVRDDIDRLIAKKYSLTPAMKKAAEQEARALQKSMEATTRAQALIVGDEIMRSGECLYTTLPHTNQQEMKFQERLSKDIAALTANTKERFTAYWSANKLMGGAVFKQARGLVCD